MSFIFAGAIVFCAGDYLAITLNISLLFWQIFLGAALVSSVATFFLKSSKKAYLGATALFLFAAGGFVGAGAAKIPADHISLFVNGDIYLQGEIIPGTIKESEEGKIGLQLEAKQVEQKGKKQPAQGIVRLSVSKYPKNKVFPRYGKLLVKGSLLPITGFANPGVFNSEQMARIQDIGGRMSVKASELRYEQTSKPFMAYVSDIGFAMRKKLSKTMDKRDSSVLAGMVLGGYDGIDADIVRSFSTTGIVHILSVSGSHIALLIGVILAVMNYSKITRKAAIIAAVFVIIGYALLCGFSPPVLRSVLMGLAMLLGLSLGKDADRGAILAGVVILMLCYRPLWLLDIGFQLSFLSTAGLIYITPIIRPLLVGKLPTFVADSLAVCLAAQLAVIPFLVYYFHQLSPCSLIANVVVVPIIEIILIITLGGLVLSFIVPPLGSILLIAASLVLWPCLVITDWIAGWGWATIAVPKTPVYMAIVYYLAVWTILKFYPLQDLSVENRKICGILCVLVLLGQQGFNLFLTQGFEVYFLDVGQGDSALVITPERKSILVDTGGFKGNYNTGERIVLPVMRYLGLKKLDLLILSHGHLDHAGGAARLAQLVPIDNVLLPREKPCPEVDALLYNLGPKTNVENMFPGEKISLGNCIIDIIDAPKQIEESSNANENSAITQIRYGKNSILFTGDATGEGELRTINKDIKAQVLKISHHGSPSSSEIEFLQAVEPKTAIISVGSNNTFGHPSKEVLEKLDRLKIATYRTDKLGAIKVTFDGSHHECYSYRYQKEYF
jgi:competence protein ComEC